MKLSEMSDLDKPFNAAYEAHKASKAKPSLRLSLDLAREKPLVPTDFPKKDQKGKRGVVDEDGVVRLGGNFTIKDLRDLADSLQDLGVTEIKFWGAYENPKPE